MSVSCVIVFIWHRGFKDGRQKLEDIERQGREAVIYLHVQDGTRRDRRLTIRELFNISDKCKP